jgi:HAD superfamily hydrolase (TIGR01450 family)
MCVSERRLSTWLERHGDDVDALMLDVDGVLMTSRRALPGAQPFIDALRARRVPFVLITNDACHSPEEKCLHLRGSGVEVAADELVSAGHALVELVREQGWQGRRFFRMGSLGVPCYGIAAGLEVTDRLDDLADCAGVLVGEKDYDWEPVITGVFNFLIRNPDAPLVVPNPDEYFARSGGILHPASGATGRFVRQLCHSYGHVMEPVYLGKPCRPIFRHAERVLAAKLTGAIDPQRVLVVGDSLNGDIRGGAAAGCRTALVLTGITSRAMLATADALPDLVFEGL